MESKTEREPISNGKYVLIAHERGSNLYVLADSEYGNIIACNRKMLEEHYRYSESLTSFRTLVANLWRRGKENVRLGVIPKGGVEEYVEKEARRMFNWAIDMMGRPPKERVDFFSVPEEVVATLSWIPKKP